MNIITDEKAINEILSRGTEDIIDRESLKRRLLSGKRLNIKFGIDPTGPQIHLGRATVLLKLKDFQKLGHKITLIIGNFTALIGVASNKTALRNPLTEKEFKENLKEYLSQIGEVLDMKGVDVKYNKDWLGKLKIEELVKLSMNFTAQQMIQRRNFKERWDGAKPIGLHELLYPLFQGYDSVAIKSDLELGGFDQLFNLKTGRELQRIAGQEPQEIMTVKMIYGLDGRKMSTSWGNVINILDKPEDMFGKILSLRDELIGDYLECCTRMPMEEVRKIEKQLVEKTINPKEAKKILAKEIITFFYNSGEAEKAEKEFEKVHEDGQLPSEIEEIGMEEKEMDFPEFLVEINLAKSKGDARRLIEQGGVKLSINGKTTVPTDWKEKVRIEKGMIVQSGKRNFRKII